MFLRLTDRLVAVLLVFGGLLLAGCADSSSPSGQPGPTRPPAGSIAGGVIAPERGRSTEANEPNEPATPAPSDAGDNADSASGDAATVRVVDEKEFAQVIEQHRGKVVLVDVWATWCLSCLELFPHTVELSKRLADRGLVVISLSLDDPEIEPSVLEKLRSNGATFENFISRYGGSDKSLEAFDLADGVLPIYRIYDRSGSVHKTLQSSEAPITAETVDRAVEEALEQP